jgi:hypothetical protein
MTKRNREREPLPPANLLGSRLEIEQMLRKQVEIGQQLITLEIQSEQALNQARADCDRWSNYNRELLLRFFDNRSVADEYERFHGGSFPLNPSVQQQVQLFRDSVADKVNRLLSIVERLKLIPVVSSASPTPGSQSAPTASGGMPKTVYS